MQTINFDKAHSQKSNAVRDIRKAIKTGQFKTEELEVVVVPAGYAIVRTPEPEVKALIRINTSQPAPALSDAATAVLRALVRATIWNEKDLRLPERVGVWVRSACVHDSASPHGLDICAVLAGGGGVEAGGDGGVRL